MRTGHSRYIGHVLRALPKFMHNPLKLWRRNPKRHLDFLKNTSNFYNITTRRPTGSVLSTRLRALIFLTGVEYLINDRVLAIRRTTFGLQATGEARG